MLNRVKVRKLKSWRNAAMLLYFKVYGRRCVRCSGTVELAKAELYSMDVPGLGGDLVLVHRKCGKA